MDKPLQLLNLDELRTKYVGTIAIYDYRIERLIRVIDGDTIKLALDLGFDLTFSPRFRILKLNTPERGKFGFAEATKFVENWINSHDYLRAETFKADSFGRWLARVYDPLTGTELYLEVIDFMDKLGVDSRYKS